MRRHRPKPNRPLRRVSNPAHVTPAFFTAVRELFAGTQEARSRGYQVGRFSFNVKGRPLRKRAKAMGVIKVEMHFFARTCMCPCDVCKGKTLQPRKPWKLNTRAKTFTKCWK